MSKLEYSAAGTASRIAAADDHSRYDPFAVALHWSMVMLVVSQFGLAELWDLVSRSTRHTMIAAHMTYGILLAAVVVLSLVWGFSPGHRVRRATTGVVDAAAKAMQFLPYALFLTQAARGFVLRWSGNEAMGFIGLQILPPFPLWTKSANHLVGDIHSYVGWTIVALAAAHTLAALFHHFVLGDDVLWRMLSGRHVARQEPRAPAPEQAARSPARLGKSH